MTLARLTLVSALGAALLGVACGDYSSGPQSPPGTQLVKSGGDQQAWYFNNPLPTPYSVTAQDANSRPVPGVVVTWAVASGGGSVDPPQSRTDLNGLASATHTLGPTAPTQAVTAAAPGLPTLTFTATATSPPTAAAVTVGNDFFNPRDVTVKVNGTVTWTWNSAGVFHDVTYTGGPMPLPQSSPTQAAGMHGSTYATAAKYDYVCTIHAGMVGTITVVR